MSGFRGDRNTCRVYRVQGSREREGGPSGKKKWLKNGDDWSLGYISVSPN